MYEIKLRTQWMYEKGTKFIGQIWIVVQVDFIEYILQSSIYMTLPVYYMYLQSRGTKYFHTCTLNAT